MITKRATMGDLANAMRLAMAFVRESPLTSLIPTTVDEQRETFECLTNMMISGLVVIAYRDDGEPAGIIGGYYVPVWWRSDVKMALEYLWYVTPRSRGSKAALQLKNLFESEAKAGGAKFALMQAGVVENSPAVEFLRRTGYTVQGPMCIKEL